MFILQPFDGRRGEGKMLDFQPGSLSARRMSDEPDLNAAFALKTPQDSVRLYRDWAGTYDAGFAARTGYRLPDAVAQAFAAAGGAGPVLDVGAGTGLVAARLVALQAGPVDGIDISPDMLAMARAKGLYRNLILADLLQGLALPGGSYHGVTSSGTFTHGHVGPEVLDELLRMAAPGATFALSVNAGVYVTKGFQAAFAAIAGRITRFSILEAPIYDRPDLEHAGERAQIITFHKA